MSVSMISSLELHAFDESSVQLKLGSTASLNSCFVRWSSTLAFITGS